MHYYQEGTSRFNPKDTRILSEEQKAEFGCLIRTIESVGSSLSGERLVAPHFMYMERKDDLELFRYAVDALKIDYYADGVLTPEEDRELRSRSHDFASILTRDYVDSFCREGAGLGKLGEVMCNCQVDYMLGDFSLAKEYIDQGLPVACIFSMRGSAHIAHIGYDSNGKLCALSDYQFPLNGKAIEKINAAMTYLSEKQDEFSFLVFKRVE